MNTSNRAGSTLKIREVKSKKEGGDNMDRIKKVVLLPDIHYPHWNPTAFKAVLKFIKWVKPNEVILLGDAMNMDTVNHWKKNKGDILYFEGKRMRTEYANFDRDVLKPIERAIGKNAKKIYMGGNHEDWVNQVVDKFPQLQGMVEPDICLKLHERNWIWIPYVVNNADGTWKRGTYTIGKLLVFHGQYTNKYHSAKTASQFSKSVAYGHTHDIQMSTSTTQDDYMSYHTAQSIGCLANLSPEFLQGRANRWVNAFGIVYLRKGGYFNLYVPIIVKGKFVYAGKIFDGNS